MTELTGFEEGIVVRKVVRNLGTNDVVYEVQLGGDLENGCPSVVLFFDMAIHAQAFYDACREIQKLEVLG